MYRRKTFSQGIERKKISTTLYYIYNNKEQKQKITQTGIPMHTRGKLKAKN